MSTLIVVFGYDLFKRDNNSKGECGKVLSGDCYWRTHTINTHIASLLSCSLDGAVQVVFDILYIL